MIQEMCLIEIQIPELLTDAEVLMYFRNNRNNNNNNKCLPENKHLLLELTLKHGKTSNQDCIDSQTRL